MPLNIDQLENRLRGGLEPVYVVAGDEPLLVQEAADRIRAEAREQGFNEREVLAVSPGFDWGRLRESGANLSLFATKRVIELHLPDAKPGTAGARALKDYAGAPPADTLLMVLAGPLDRSARSSAWLKALEGAGVAAYAWPVKTERLPSWLTKRMRATGLSPESGSAETLAMLTEGNLVAAQQAVSRLALLYPRAGITPERVRECVADNARFTVFDLADKALAGKTAPALRSLGRLREEGVDPVLILWILARELRLLAAVAGRVRRGSSPEQALAAERVWASRKRLIAKAARRLGEGRALALLQAAARVDAVNKGARIGRPWEELLSLCAAIASKDCQYHLFHALD